jgi:phosphatidylglycerophosphate synthase
MVRPLVDTAVTPNHLTSVRLAVGLSSVSAFAAGGYLWSNVGAWLFVLSNLLDHTDGELARISGKFSRLGHLYDLSSDALIHVLLFMAVGFSLRHGPLGVWAPALGLIAGVTVSLIFSLRMEIEYRLGKAGTRQPSFAGFEIEDVLYLLPLVTLADVLQPFLIAAAVGVPAFSVWVIRDYLRLSNAGGRGV